MRPVLRLEASRASWRPPARYLPWPTAPPGAAMFYRPEEPHGLRGDPLNAIVVPRPIGWISTLDAAGRATLAPYSFFNAVAYRPPHVMFSATGPTSAAAPRTASPTSPRPASSLSTWR